jgi:hypothetical protein
MKWKAIPGYSAYEISDEGELRRAIGARYHKPGRRNRPGSLLKPSGKYGCYALVDDFGKITWGLRTNRLMLLTFVGPPPSKKHQALHWDDDQANNTLPNLRWGLPKDNGEDKVRNGKAAKGEENAAAILTVEDVAAARADYKKGHTLHELTVKYKVTTAPMWAAITGKSWAHIGGAAPKRGQGHRSPERIPRGSANHNAKLNENTVKKIKQLLPTTKGVVLARMFSTTIHTISAIKRGKVWKHVDA